jgi:hypothetical protein
MDRSWWTGFLIALPLVIAATVVAVRDDWPTWLLEVVILVVGCIGGAVMTVLDERRDRRS